MKAGIFRWISILAAVWSTTACFNPKVPEGVACSAEGECPAGQTCDAVDNRCYSVLPNRDPDAGDTPPPDGPTTPDANDGSPPPDAPPGVTPPDAQPPDAPPANCENQMTDGQETDMDCGGPDCPACVPGRMCLLARDCASQVCGGNQLCAAPVCGDGVINQPIEECDDGMAGPPPNNDNNTPDACRESCVLPSCGDDVVDTGEEVDPPTSPSSSVPVNSTTCRYDFSAMRQLSCNNACGTTWNGIAGCQEEDADTLCKLITGNPNSTVVDPDTSFNVEATLAAPGICCPPPATAPGTLGCVHLGNMNRRGVNVEVSVHDTNMSTTHGTGAAVTVQSAAACTNP